MTEEEIWLAESWENFHRLYLVNVRPQNMGFINCLSKFRPNFPATRCHIFRYQRSWNQYWDSLWIIDLRFKLDFVYFPTVDIFTVLNFNSKSSIYKSFIASFSVFKLSSQDFGFLYMSHNRGKTIWFIYFRIFFYFVLLRLQSYQFYWDVYLRLASRIFHSFLDSASLLRSITQYRDWWHSRNKATNKSEANFIIESNIFWHFFNLFFIQSIVRRLTILLWDFQPDLVRPNYSTIKKIGFFN